MDWARSAAAISHGGVQSPIGRGRSWAEAVSLRILQFDPWSSSFRSPLSASIIACSILSYSIASTAYSQVPTVPPPAVGGSGAASQVPAAEPTAISGKRRSTPFVKVAWPFRRKNDGPLPVSDPFVTSGAASQEQLARQFQTPSSTAVAPATNPPANGPASASPVPSTNEMSAVLPSRPYPWPAPVDTRPPGAPATIDQEIWGNAARTPDAPATMMGPPDPTLPVPTSDPMGPPPPASSTNRAVSLAGMTPDRGSRVLAIVGNQTILANDLIAGIDARIKEVARQAPPEVVNAELDSMFQKMIPRAIETKLLFLEYLRMVPPEVIVDMEEKSGKVFDEQDLAKYMKDMKASSTADLDAKLRATGTSLMRVKRNHFEMEVARQILPRIMEFDPEVSHEQRLAYYREHYADYYRPQRVRWERLTASFERTGSPEAARQLIAKMGDEVLGGAPLAEVAKRESQCPMASQGGQYDWTRQGSLASKTIDSTLATIPIGKLSRILEDSQGLHIVRVLEREPAHYQSFEEVQNEVIEKVKEERWQAKLQTTLDRLKKETYVWTLYDSPSGQPGEMAGQSAPQEWVTPVDYETADGDATQPQ